jgi:hypothetical protein
LATTLEWWPAASSHLSSGFRLEAKEDRREGQGLAEHRAGLVREFKEKQPAAYETVFGK